jgi:hypothetical protein
MSCSSEVKEAYAATLEGIRSAIRVMRNVGHGEDPIEGMGLLLSALDAWIDLQVPVLGAKHLQKGFAALKAISMIARYAALGGGSIDKEAIKLIDPLLRHVKQQQKGGRHDEHQHWGNGSASEADCPWTFGE